MVAAQEAGVSLQEFSAYEPPIKMAWMDYAVNGMSHFRHRIHTLGILNIKVAEATAGKKRPTVEDSGLLDGLIDHPEVVRRARREREDAQMMQFQLDRARAAMGLDTGSDEADKEQ